jgi:hypothetical protein
MLREDFFEREEDWPATCERQGLACQAFAHFSKNDE